MVNPTPLLQKHDNEIEQIKVSLNEITLDLQLLLKDHKFLADKVNDITNHNKTIEEILLKLKFWHEKKDAFWDNLLNKWVKIMAFIISIISIILIVYFHK